MGKKSKRKSANKKPSETATPPPPPPPPPAVVDEVPVAAAAVAEKAQDEAAAKPSINDNDEEEPIGNVFDALDDAMEEEDNENVPPPLQDEANSKSRPSIVYRKPVTLLEDSKTGEKYFYLQKDSFPNRSITNLAILYTPAEKAQVHEQVQADPHCPSILLKNIKVVCTLDTAGGDNDDEPLEKKLLLHDESFRLSGSKIVAIQMRMYAAQKQEAQTQLMDPNCRKVILKLDMDCRLGNRT